MQHRWKNDDGRRAPSVMLYDQTFGDPSHSEMIPSLPRERGGGRTSWVLRRGTGPRDIIEPTIISCGDETLIEDLEQEVCRRPTAAVVIINPSESSCLYGVISQIVWGSEIYVLDDSSSRHTTEIRFAEFLKLSAVEPLSDFISINLANRYPGLWDAVDAYSGINRTELASTLTAARGGVNRLEKLRGATGAADFVEKTLSLYLGRDGTPREVEYLAGCVDRGESAALDVCRRIWFSEEGVRHRSDNPFHRRQKSVYELQNIEHSDIALPLCEAPLVSVLIPVYKQLRHTLNCLKSISDNPPACAFEVLVLDDNSPDDSVAELRKVNNLRIVENPENLGFLRSCNRGSGFARGRYLFFLNNDTVVTPGWLDELVDTYKYFPTAGLIGSKLIYPDGKLQEAGGIIWADGSGWNYGRGDDPTLSRYNYARETDYCSGAAILIEKALFEGLGRFDERYSVAYCEDSSLAFNVREAGRTVIYQPKSAIVHFEGVSHGTSTTDGIKSHQVSNQRLFAEIWEARLKQDHFPNGTSVFLARERSRKKPIVLICDHYVPQPDRDAGSRTMIQIVKSLLEHGVVVKFWPENLHRDPSYTGELEKLGVEVFYGVEYKNKFAEWVIENGRYLHAVILSRPHIAYPLLSVLREHTAAKLLYYGHDLHHARLQLQLAVDWSIGVAAEMEHVRNQEQSIWETVDVVFYPAANEVELVNQYLKSRKKPATALVLPPYAYDEFPQNPSDNLADRKGLLMVAGWSHTPNVEGVNWFIEEVLPIIRDRFPSVSLTLVGSNPPPEFTMLAEKRIVSTGFVTDSKLEDFYAGARVVIAPLRIGAGVKGKVVESMRFGVPCVTTTVGAQGLPDPESYLAISDDPRGFAKKVLELLQSDVSWRSRSKVAQLRCKSDFSPDFMWRSLERGLGKR
jgi:GT2 family glycosyltransferase